MLRSVFGKSFNAGKCKTLLRLAISRIKLLKNKRDMQVKQMRRELGQLLQAKQELTARIRVEHVFREQNILAAYEIIELFSELLVVRLPIIESQRQCPIDLREAIASLIFAAPRCADLPELQDISSLFAVKYGKDFVAAAAELRPDCGVNRLVIEKLSVRAPSGEVRLKLMKEIAEEQGVDWDTAEFEAELHKPSKDLLDGPDQFMKTTQGSFQAPLKDLSSSSEDHQNEDMENEKGSAPFMLPDPPSGCQRHSVSPRHKKHVQEPGNFEPKKEESYKDAADAARAAALSAERAAAAAIAVASLAKENFTRMSSDNISNRHIPESSSGSDDDKNETTVPENPLPSTNEYFKIQMDSFNAHVNNVRSGSHDGNAGFGRPVFDEYPEDKPRYVRVQTGVIRKQTVGDFSSDDDESDSTEGSASSPVQRGGRVEGHTASRHAACGSDSWQSSGTRRHYDDDDSGFHYHENASQPRGSARKVSGVGPPLQRPPPNLAHNQQHFSPHTAPSHVHPKLPDYDDLSARFGALKSRN